MRLRLLGAPALSLLLLGSLPGQEARAGALPFSLTVTPPRIVVPYTPGQTVSTPVRISNPASTPLHIDVLLSIFSQGPDGSMHFSAPAADSGASWVAVSLHHFDVLPHAEKAIDIALTVPPNADPGERQVGVILRVPAGAGPGNITVTGAVGIEVLAGAPGPVVERTALDRLDAPGFSAGGAIPLTLTVSERGNVHREFVAPHQLSATSAGSRIMFPEFIVLRGVTRTAVTSWKEPPLLCICTATVTTDDGQGREISVSKTIVIFPVGGALGSLALILALGFGGWKLRQVRRRRRRAELARVAEEAYARAREEMGGVATESVDLPDSRGDRSPAE